MKYPHAKDRLPEYIPGIIAGKHTQTQVALWTGYTREHICRLVQRYKKEGPDCLINGHTGKPGPRAIPQEVKDKIVNIYKSDFVDDGVGTQFTIFRGCLEAEYGIKLAYNTIYKILTSAGIESPEKRKKNRKKAHHPRQRRASEGEMLQADASSYAWFWRFGDDARYALHGAIDDATGAITALYMTANECSYGYYSVLEQTIKKHGLPSLIYTDKSPIFCVNPKEKDKLTTPEQLAGKVELRTQWQRILFELCIGQILAHSPQAKGRIERLWRTLQACLPIIFKLRKVKTIEEANRFLAEEFVPAFNAKFTVEARKPPVWRCPPKDWENCLCAQVERKANGADVISYMNHKLLIRADCAYRKVTLCIFKDKILALYKGRYYSVELVEDPKGRDHAPAVLREIIDKTLKTAGKHASA